MAQFPQKRKQDGSFHHQPSAPKRSRPDNGHHQHPGSLSNLYNQPIPTLPMIDPFYEKIVFTHSSVAARGSTPSEMVNYDRLEFLGDAWLEVIASHVIFERFNAASAGTMSSLRESLVRNGTLNQFSCMYGFDKKLQIAQAIIKDDTKINADVFEAYIAAVVRSDTENGFVTAKEWLIKLWEPILSKANLPKVDVRSKEELAKKVMAKGIRLDYSDEKPAVFKKGLGTQTFFVGVYLTGWGFTNECLGSGQGLSKNAAGQEAASNALANTSMIEKIVAKRTAYLEERKAEGQSSNKTS